MVLGWRRPGRVGHRQGAFRFPHWSLGRRSPTGDNLAGGPALPPPPSPFPPLRHAAHSSATLWALRGPARRLETAGSTPRIRSQMSRVTHKWGAGPSPPRPCPPASWRRQGSPSTRRRWRKARLVEADSPSGWRRPALRPGESPKADRQRRGRPTGGATSSCLSRGGRHPPPGR